MRTEFWWEGLKGTEHSDRARCTWILNPSDIPKLKLTGHCWGFIGPYTKTKKIHERAEKGYGMLQMKRYLSRKTNEKCDPATTQHNYTAYNHEQHLKCSRRKKGR
jgi:hypothetical protein